MGVSERGERGEGKKKQKTKLTACDKNASNEEWVRRDAKGVAGSKEGGQRVAQLLGLRQP